MLWNYILDFVRDLMDYASGFNLNPAVFLIVYFGTTPFILVPVYFLGRIAAKKTDKKYFLPLIITLVLAIVAPYLYVIVFGKGINIFIKLAVFTIAVLSLIRYLSKKLNIRVFEIIKKRIEDIRNRRK